MSQHCNATRIFTRWVSRSAHVLWPNHTPMCPEGRADDGIDESQLGQLAKRLAERQPAAHRAAIGIVGRAKFGVEMRFFVEDDKEMRK